MNDFDKKVDRAIKFIKSVGNSGNINVAYSGGKDSDVVRRLCELAGINFTLVYNNTTIDPPFTLARNKRVGAIVNQPKYTFLQLVEKKGLPSMFRRFCCSYLKEQYISDKLILGIRRAESVKRNKRYLEPQACRIYSNKKYTSQFLPIISWADEDIFRFIEEENLKLHPLYYTNGKLDITKRLGCIGCPLKGDRGRSDFIEYPKMLRQIVRSYSKYVNNHKAIEGIYEDIIWNLFYSNHGDEKFQQTFHGLFSPPDPKKLLETYFNVNLTLK